MDSSATVAAEGTVGIDVFGFNVACGVGVSGGVTLANTSLVGNVNYTHSILGNNFATFSLKACTGTPEGTIKLYAIAPIIGNVPLATLLDVTGTSSCITVP